MNRVKWSNVISEHGTAPVKDFAVGNLSRDEAIVWFPEHRGFIRQRGVAEARRVTRKALRRRGLLN